MPQDPNDTKARALQDGTGCFTMSKTWAFFEALMGSKHDYRTPEGVQHIKEDCFDGVAARPLQRLGVPQEEIDRIRATARQAAFRR